jgi:hypothetical protein
MSLLLLFLKFNINGNLYKKAFYIVRFNCDKFIKNIANKINPLAFILDSLK